MDVKVIKSPNDPKNYKVFRLENGLTVMLISQDEEEKSENVASVPKRKCKWQEMDRLKRKVGCDCCQNDKVETFLKRRQIGLHACNTRKENEESCDEAQEKKEDQNCCDENKIGDDDDGDNGGDDNAGGEGKARPSDNVCPQMSDQDAGYISAASLCVSVGSLSDPKDIPGLAHYLEHMVFMGSEKYPATNDFDLFIKGHGGSTNAHTDYERTHFHFEIQSRYFCQALDRFAQFFICPLLHRKARIAEARVVHAEWEMSLQKERSRQEQLMLSMADSGSPFNNFMWGNYTTLVETPKKNKTDVLKALQSFRKKFYVAQNMALCIYTDSNPTIVEKFVRDIFSKIPSSIEKIESFKKYGDPFDTAAFRKIYKVVPVQNTHQLEVTWTLPSMTEFYRCRPLHYIEQLIGDKRAGSLFSKLHKKNWILSLCCGNNGGGMDWNSCMSLFRVIFCLTEEGFKNWFEIITFLFQYIRMLRCVGAVEKTWKEMYQIQLNEFIFSEATNYQDYVDLICTSMLEFELRDYVISNYVVTQFSPQLIEKCLQYMVPERMNIVMRAQCFSQTADQEEEWFKTRYSTEEIPSSWMKKWKNPPKIFRNSMHMPLPNQFIATDFSLKSIEKQHTEMKAPLISTQLGRVWYQSDDEFQIPKAHIYIYLWSEHMNRTATESCLSDMYINYIKKSLLEETYPAEIAYFTHHISLFNNGLVLKLGGFNHTLRLLFELYIKKMSCLEIEEAFFELTKLQLIDHYTNKLMCPETLNSQMHLSHLLPQSWTYLQKLHCIKTINIHNFETYISKIFKGNFFEILIQGNISSKEALSLTAYMVDHLQLVAHHNRININVTEVLPGSTIMALANQNSKDTNSVITNYYQFGPSCLEDNLLNELMLLMMEEPCFEELRTRKQLGYNVFPTAVSLYGILGFNITACSQAQKFSMEELDQAIEEFLTNFHNKIVNLTEEEFQKNKATLENSRGLDGTLIGRVERCWEEVMNHEYLFERPLLESKKIGLLTLRDLQSFCAKIIPANPAERKKLSLQVVGNDEEI